MDGRAGRRSTAEGERWLAASPATEATTDGAAEGALCTIAPSENVDRIPCSARRPLPPGSFSPAASAQARPALPPGLPGSPPSGPHLLLAHPSPTSVLSDRRVLSSLLGPSRHRRPSRPARHPWTLKIAVAAEQLHACPKPRKQLLPPSLHALQQPLLVDGELVALARAPDASPAASRRQAEATVGNATTIAPQGRRRSLSSVRPTAAVATADGRRVGVDRRLALASGRPAPLAATPTQAQQAQGATELDDDGRPCRRRQAGQDDARVRGLPQGKGQGARARCQSSRLGEIAPADLLYCRAQQSTP